MRLKLGVLCAILLCSGCSGVMWDFMCHNINVAAVNAQGENLLRSGQIDIRNISIDYNGKTYVYREETKFIPPEPLAIRINQNEAHEIIGFSFGEFTPTSDYKEEQFTINWGDGTSDCIAFDLYTKGTNRNQKVKSALYLNGEPAGSLPFDLTITK